MVSEKEKKIPLSYFSETMNGYEKDSNRDSENDLLLMIMVIMIQSHIWIAFYYPSNAFAHIVDQEKTSEMQSHAMVRRYLRAGLLLQFQTPFRNRKTTWQWIYNPNNS